MGHRTWTKAEASAAARTHRPSCNRARARAGKAAVESALVLVLVGLGAPPVLARQPDAAPAGVEGSWHGSLSLPGGVSLRLVVHVERAADGALAARMDSPDQGAFGIPVERASFENDRLDLELPALGARFAGTLERGDTIAGVFQQSGLSFPLRLARGEMAAPNRPQEPQPPFPYAVEEVRFRNESAGIELAGTLTLPRGRGPFPAVALVTGSGPQDRDEALAGHRPFLVLADHLTRNGIAVLRYDDRGVGQSGGDFATATTRDFAADARAAVAYLRSRAEVNDDAVGLIGHSEGGMIAFMVAAEPDAVDFIVALAGTGLPGEEILYLQGQAIARAMGAPEGLVGRQLEIQRALFSAVRDEPDPERRRARAEEAVRNVLQGIAPEERIAMGIAAGTEEEWLRGQVESVTSSWFHFFLTYDPRQDLRRIRVPVLVLIGEKDLQVPPAENADEIRNALAAGGNGDFTVTVLPGLNHLFQTAETGSPAEYARIEETFSPQALEAISSWMGARF